jgi:formylglycine-generating enzyme required for sulfatase activity
MLPDKYQWIGDRFEPEGDPRHLFDIARELEDEGNLQGAATVYDRAYGLDPTAVDVRERRARLLDQLLVVEHGLHFRYIPGGVFLMGCGTGEEDERPRHLVWLSPYWMSETPVSWAAYCRLMDWEPPPAGHPRRREPQQGEVDREVFYRVVLPHKIRLRYCEDGTRQAGDWHRYYDTKPMVAVAWQEVFDLTSRLSTDRVCYSLPTEAQWEKAARGALIGARHAWGNEPPTRDRCDFDRFQEFSIHPMTSFPPNGYGLYAVNGGVWEWTRDWYDRDYYRHSPEVDPGGPAEGQEKVLRGGSWADCADVVTVTFRMSRGSRSLRWTEGAWSGRLAPNIGFRLCRTVVS